MQEKNLNFDLKINLFDKTDLTYLLRGCYCEKDIDISIKDLNNIKKSISSLMFGDSFNEELKKVDSCINILEKITKINNIEEKNKLKKTFNEQIMLIPLYDVFFSKYYSNVTSLDNVNDTGYIRFERNIDNNTIGKNLLDFISYNIDNYEQFILLFINFPDCIVSFMTKKEIDVLESTVNLPITYIKELCEKYYNKTKDFIKSQQNTYKEIIDFVYNINQNIDFKGISNIEKLGIFNFITDNKISKILDGHYIQNDTIETTLNDTLYSWDFAINDDLNKIIEFTKQNSKLATNTYDISYKTKDIYTAFLISLYHLITYDSIFIRKCKNCSNYFITFKNNVVYCDRLYTNNETCKDIGYKISQKRKEEKEYTYGKYRRIYAKKAMLVKRNPDIEKYRKDYEIWKKEAKKFMKDINNGVVTYNEFDKWLEDHI